jgi:hypothetical protein
VILESFNFTFLTPKDKVAAGLKEARSMKKYWDGGIAPRILDFGTRRR